MADQQLNSRLGPIQALGVRTQRRRQALDAGSKSGLRSTTWTMIICSGCWVVFRPDG
jgi:hypothetical protein